MAHQERTEALNCKTDAQELPRSLQRKACRVHLVGVFLSRNYVHLGPYTLPSESEGTPSLLEFATTMKRLIRMTQGQDTWWRLEYNCYGNQVPILSDEALKEAFNYFREQHEALNPEAAAAACRLFLWPTGKQPEAWSLAEYLNESRMVHQSQNPTVSQHSGDQGTAAGVHHEPSLAHNAAVAAGGASSSSSSHEASGHQLTTTTTAAGAGAGAGAASNVQRVSSDEPVSGVPPVLVAAADHSSFTAGRPPQQQRVWSAADAAAVQLQHSHHSQAAVSLRVAKRQAVGSSSDLTEAVEQQSWHTALHSSMQPQQSQAAPIAAGDACQLLNPLMQLSEVKDAEAGDDFRTSKAAKRGSGSSPRSQWQQQQHSDAAASSQQTAAGYVSPFALLCTTATSTAAATAPHAMLPTAAQSQLELVNTVPAPVTSVNGVSQSYSNITPAPQQHHVCYNHATGPDLASGAVSHAAGRADGDAEAAGRADVTSSGLGPQLDQLQQLRLTAMSQNSVQTSSAAATTAELGFESLAAMDHWQQQQQQQQPMAGTSAVAAGLQRLSNTGFTSLPYQAGSVVTQHHTNGGVSTAASQINLAALDSQQQAAAVAATGRVGSIPHVAAAIIGGVADGGSQGLPVTLVGGRSKSETKTKYADGRFKDEVRHQQRLNDMRQRCNALFGGAIVDRFRIEHHKRAVCLVCNATVVPYEAYHIDAIRKHFVRHHEPWLTDQGVDVDMWRKSCAPIAKGQGSVRSSSSSAQLEAPASVSVAAAAVSEDSTEAAADETVGRRITGTRLPDGRYKDPQHHAQRLADMHARCAALFSGTMTQHWTINDHKSITCHLCNQHITPYAAYHPDCLRKHFVRKHEDVLVAAGVDVAAWSKGIPLGRRKLKAKLLQQQQQQQQQQQHLGPQQLLPADLLQQLQQQQGLQQAGLLQSFGSAGAVPLQHALPQQQQQQHQQLLLPQLSQAVSWPLATTQQQQQDVVQHSSGLTVTTPSLLPQQQQQQHVQYGSGSAAAAVPPDAVLLQQQVYLQLQQQLTNMQQQQQHQEQAHMLATQQQQVSRVASPIQGLCSTTSPQPPSEPLHAAASQADLMVMRSHLQPQHSAGLQQDILLMPVQQQQQTAVRPWAASAPTNAVSAAAVVTSAQLPAIAPAVVQFSQPDVQLELSGQAAATVQPDASTATETGNFAACGYSSNTMEPQVHIQQPQPQQLSTVARSARSALAPALAAAAAATSQALQQQQQSAADWAHNVVEASLPLIHTPGYGPMSLGLTPGFGPMSLSPMFAGLTPTDASMGVVASLTEADVAAMWADDDGADQEGTLAEVLLGA